MALLAVFRLSGVVRPGTTFCSNAFPRYIFAVEQRRIELRSLLKMLDRLIVMASLIGFASFVQLVARFQLLASAHGKRRAAQNHREYPKTSGSFHLLILLLQAWALKVRAWNLENSR